MKDLDMSKLQYSPSMLHVEVVPFIFGESDYYYDTNIINKYIYVYVDIYGFNFIFRLF